MGAAEGMKAMRLEFGRRDLVFAIILLIFAVGGFLVITSIQAGNWLLVVAVLALLGYILLGGQRG